jgi:O-methyltransferase
MNEGSATRRIRRMDSLRRLLSSSVHALRKAVTPSLRGDPAHSTLVSTATYSPWCVDAEFRATLKEIGGHTLLDEMRLHELWQLADQVGHLWGDGIEIGCWRGGAGCLIARRLASRRPNATMFLCDTFAGVVKAGDRDREYRGGEHDDAGESTVLELARSMGLKNVEVLVGIFPEDTGSQVEDRTFTFAHIDVDVYDGARDAFHWLLPRLAVGGIVVFDDYGSTATRGIRLLVDELHGHPDLAIVRNLNGQAVAVRRAATTPAPRTEE